MSATEDGIRPMVVADLEAVQRVARSAGERFRAVDDERIARCADDPPIGRDTLVEAIVAGWAWVVLADGEVAGFLVAEELGDAAHVEEVAVGGQLGGRGLGTALLQAVAGRAQALGKAAVTLTTFRDVPFNRPFYERRGFQVLRDDQLTADLVARRAAEEAAGLPADLRVVMRRSLRDP